MFHLFVMLDIISSEKKVQELRFVRFADLHRGRTWTLLMIAFQPSQLEETTRRQFLGLKKD